MKNYELEIRDFNAVKIIGKKISIKFGGNAKKHVQNYLKNGDGQFLQGLPTRISPDEDLICWMGESNLITKTFSEMPGIFANKNSQVPEGFDAMDIPDCKMAILWIEGSTPSLEKGAHNLLLKHLRDTVYIEDYSLGFSMEYYTSIGFSILDIENPKYKFGYFLPCKKR